jgi:hypothetical protein
MALREKCMRSKRYLAFAAILGFGGLLACSEGTTIAPDPASPAKNPANPFGIMSTRTFGASNMSTVRELGTRWYRPRPVLLKLGTTSEDAAAFSDFQLILTVKNTTYPDSASTPPADLNAYRAAIARVIDTYRPAILVIENEEDLPKYWAGTPQEYGVMLQAAVAEAHAKGVKVTNGGLLSGSVVYATYQAYLDAGETAKAEDYRKRAFGSWQSPARAKEFSDRTKGWLDVGNNAGVDYVNIHSYVDDGPALTEAVAFVRGYTGKPVLTNEIGHRDNSSITTLSLVQAVLDSGLPVAVWWTPTLTSPDGTLRATGEAARDFIRARFGRIE